MSRIQSGVYGGWWGSGLGFALPGDYSIDESTGEILDTTGNPLPPLLEMPPGVYDVTPEQIARANARGDFVQATTAIQAIAALAKAGIQAVSPGSTGACPAGYVKAGLACVPTAQASGLGVGTSGSIIPGISNNTLFLVAGGVLFLILLSSSGGWRR